MREAIQTKLAFGDALKELLKTQSFEKVTVSGICEQANLKRTSFYYYFLDKYDLANWVFDYEYVEHIKNTFGVQDLYSGEFAEEIPEEVPEGFDDWLLVQATAEFFQENISFYSKVIDFQGQNSFLDHFRELLEPPLHTMLRGSTKDNKDIEFLVNFYADAILATLMRWIKDPKRVSPTELVRLSKYALYFTGEYLEATTGDSNTK